MFISTEFAPNIYQFVYSMVQRKTLSRVKSAVSPGSYAALSNSVGKYIHTEVESSITFDCSLNNGPCKISFNQIDLFWQLKAT